MKRKIVKAEFVKTEKLLQQIGISDVWPQSVSHMRQVFPRFRIISETIESERPLIPDDVEYLLCGPSDEEIRNSTRLR